MIAWTLDNLIVATLLAGAVTFVCRWRMLSPAARHALWAVVLVKLLMPPLFAWPWAFGDSWPVWSKPRGAETSQVAVEQSPASKSTPPTISTVDVASLPEIDFPAPHTLPPPYALPDSQPAPTFAPTGSVPPNHIVASEAPAVPESASGRRLGESLPALLGGVWLIGSLAFAALQVIRLVRMQRRLRHGVPAETELVREVERLAKRLQMKPLPVSEIAGVGTPFIWAVFRPRLWWPLDLPPGLSDVARQGLLLHELAHVKRRDHWFGWLELVAGCVWWWNPVYWLARGQMREHAELACDAWVIGALPTGRRAYAEALIAICESLSLATAPRPALSAGVRGRRPLERRLSMIMRAKVPFRLSRGALLAVLVLTATALPAWSQKSKELPAQSETIGERSSLGEETIDPARFGAHRLGGRTRTAPLPADARLALDRFEQAQRDAQRKVEQSRQDLLRQLTDLANRLTEEGRPAEAAAVRNLLRRHQAAGATPGGVLPDPLWLVEYRDRAGKSFLFDVVGDNAGSVWGTDVYTDDSRLATAAVHAGVLEIGQRGVVRVTIAPGKPSYTGSQRNGISSWDYGTWQGSYRVERAQPLHAYGTTATAQADPGSLGGFRDRVGQTLAFNLVGSASGSVWGSGIYTDDSLLSAAAVHAGVLKDGERGVVRVKILGAQDAFQGSTQHGVTTYPFTAWGGSFQFVTSRPVASRGPRSIEPDPGSLTAFQHRRGETFWFDVVGRTEGFVWGTGEYTTDSSLAKAAVHAGLLAEGERGVVEVTLLPGREAYEGSTKHGVSSASWGRYVASFRLNSVRSAEKPDRGVSGALYDYPQGSGWAFHFRKVGDSYETEILGSASGAVWGTDVYTSDSSLAAAAVHAGVIEVGERATIRVTTLEGRDSYEASTRHGVSSNSYGPWPSSIRLERVDRVRSR